MLLLKEANKGGKGRPEEEVKRNAKIFSHFEYRTYS